MRKRRLLDYLYPLYAQNKSLKAELQEARDRYRAANRNLDEEISARAGLQVQFDELSAYCRELEGKIGSQTLAWGCLGQKYADLDTAFTRELATTRPSSMQDSQTPEEAH